jgi:hypothetical protein
MALFRQNSKTAALPFLSFQRLFQNAGNTVFQRFALFEGSGRKAFGEGGDAFIDGFCLAEQFRPVAGVVIAGAMQFTTAGYLQKGRTKSLNILPQKASLRAASWHSASAKTSR